MDQDPWLAKADIQRIEFQSNLLPVFGVGWAIGALLLMVGGMVIAVAGLGGSFTIVAVGFSIVVALFAVARTATAIGQLRRVANEPDVDFSGAPAESIRRLPALHLEPVDALDIQHLDRIAWGDSTGLPDDRLRRRLSNSVWATRSVIQAAWVVGGLAIGGAAAVTIDRGVTWGFLDHFLVVLVGTLGAASLAAVSSTVEAIGRVIWAQRISRTRAVLKSRNLSDDGSPLLILVRVGDRFEVDQKRLHRRARPAPRDFTDARAEKFMKAPIGGWAVATFGVIGGVLLAVMANL